MFAATQEAYHVDRNVAAESRIAGPKDFPHAARAQGRGDLERTEAGTGFQGHGPERYTTGGGSGNVTKERIRAPSMPLESRVHSSKSLLEVTECCPAAPSFPTSRS